MLAYHASLQERQPKPEPESDPVPGAYNPSSDTGLNKAPRPSHQAATNCSPRDLKADLLPCDGPGSIATVSRAPGAVYLL